MHEYDIPQGCVGGYYPECNPLVPLWHHAEGSWCRRSRAFPSASWPMAAVKASPPMAARCSTRPAAGRLTTALVATAAFMVGAALVRRK